MAAIARRFVSWFAGELCRQTKLMTLGASFPDTVMIAELRTHFEYHAWANRLALGSLRQVAEPPVRAVKNMECDLRTKKKVFLRANFPLAECYPSRLKGLRDHSRPQAPPNARNPGCNPGKIARDPGCNAGRNPGCNGGW